MTRQRNKNPSKRIYPRPSAKVVAYLEEAANIGIYGKTPSAVAENLINRELERLIKEGFIKLKKD